MTTAAQIEASRQLMVQQDRARQQAVTAALALAASSTAAFGAWYSTAAITAWALRLALGVEAIQRNLARQTDVYLSRQATLLSGRPVRPVGAVDVSKLRQGITHPGAYGRVADQFRYQQSRIDAGEQGVQTAIEAATARAQEVAEMDTALAVRAQAQAFMEAQPEAAEAAPNTEAEAPAKARLIGYRRIVHPELSRGGTCGLCIVAAHRLYKRDDLMPIHQRCNCLPMPVYEGADPGSVINDEDLQRLYDEAGGMQAAELKRTRYQINDHGELGPMLAPQAADFRGPSDVATDERVPVLT